MKKLGVVWLLVCVAAGCAAEPTDPSAPDGQGLTLTKVRFNPDGTSESTMQYFPPTETGMKQLALAEEDIGCYDYNALWLYDSADLQGNRLCMVGSGSFWLGSYCRVWVPRHGCILSWDKSVRSLWAGARAGELRTRQPGGGDANPILYPFNPWQVDWTLSATAQDAWEVMQY